MDGVSAIHARWKTSILLDLNVHIVQMMVDISMLDLEELIRLAVFQHWHVWGRWSTSCVGDI